MVSVVEPAAVVDTNIFVSAVISPNGTPARLLEAWRHGAFRLLISAAQFEEITDVLNRSWLRDKYGVTPTQVEGLLREVDRRAHRVVSLAYSDLPLRCRDADDVELLASALGGGADYLSRATKTCSCWVATRDWGSSASYASVISWRDCRMCDGAVAPWTPCPRRAPARACAGCCAASPPAVGEQMTRDRVG